jgi:hypothetical protein
MDSQTDEQRSSGEKVGEVKIEQFWRHAKHGDVAQVMNREAVEARFRDRIDQEWKPGLLSGWSKIDKSDSLQWASSDGVFWRFCQVYEPQQWWLDKPDPGEGFRLLEKFPDEPKLWTDEAWDCHSKEWRQTTTTGETQSDCVWYRRRIEPVKPEKLDSYVDHLEVGKEYTLPSGQSIFVTEKGFELG